MSSYNDNNYDYTILNFKEMRKGLIYMYDRGKKVDDNTYLLNVEIGVGNRKYNQFKKRLKWLVEFLQDVQKTTRDCNIEAMYNKDLYSLFNKIPRDKDSIFNKEISTLDKISDKLENILRDKNEDEIKLSKNEYFFLYFCLSFKPLIEKMNSNKIFKPSKYILVEFIFSIYLELLLFFEKFDKEDSDSIVNKFEEFEEIYNNNLITYREVYNRFSEKTFNDNIFYNINIEFYSKVNKHYSIFEKFSHLNMEKCIDLFKKFFYNINSFVYSEEFYKIPWEHYEVTNNINNVIYFFENAKLLDKNSDIKKLIYDDLICIYNNIDKKFYHYIKEFKDIENTDDIEDMKIVFDYQYLKELSVKLDNNDISRKSFSNLFVRVISKKILIVFNNELYNKLTAMEEYKDRLFLINNEDND